MNDLCNTSTVLKYVLFADDTTLYMSHSDPKLLQYKFNNELKYISDWFSANKLVVNTTKTNFMVFSYRNIDCDDFDVKLNDSFITQVASVKFLGAIIDNKLSWKDHVDSVCNKISKNIGVMNRVRMLYLILS